MHEEAQQLDALVLGLGVEPPGVHPPERPRARRRVVADERELGETRPREPVVAGERVQAVGEVGDAVDRQVVVRRRRAQRPRQQTHRHPALGHRLDLLDPGHERVGDDGVPRREPRRHHQLGPSARAGAPRCGECRGALRAELLGVDHRWGGQGARGDPSRCTDCSGTLRLGLPSAGCRHDGEDGHEHQRGHPPPATQLRAVAIAHGRHRAFAGAPAHLSSSFSCIHAACCGARLVSDHSRSISHFTASSLASRASSSGSGHASSMRCPLGSKK